MAESRKSADAVAPQVGGSSDRPRAHDSSSSSASSRPSGWQPIATMPKDGAAVLVFFPESEHTAAFMCIQKPSPRAAFPPTHWMALPLPPGSDPPAPAPPDGVRWIPVRHALPNNPFDVLTNPPTMPGEEPAPAPEMGPFPISDPTRTWDDAIKAEAAPAPDVCGCLSPEMPNGERVPCVLTDGHEEMCRSAITGSFIAWPKPPASVRIAAPALEIEQKHGGGVSVSAKLEEQRQAGIEKVESEMRELVRDAGGLILKETALRFLDRLDSLRQTEEG